MNLASQKIKQNKRLSTVSFSDAKAFFSKYSILLVNELSYYWQAG